MNAGAQASKSNLAVTLVVDNTELKKTVGFVVNQFFRFGFIPSSVNNKNGVKSTAKMS